MASDPNLESPSETESGLDDLTALTQVVALLKRLDQEGRVRLFRTAAAFFEIPLGGVTSKISGFTTSPSKAIDSSNFSEDRSTTPKQFLFDKKPFTDTDRVVCLAYYLTHYRGTPHFKTLDISKLNTDAAQIKFSNAADAVENATKAGLLVPATKGLKQISAPGELYVQALPDRSAARDAIANARRKRKVKNKSAASKDSESSAEAEE